MSTPSACPAAARAVPLWRQMLADVFGKRVTTLETQEGSAYGAALLAMVGTGRYASVPEVCGVAIREKEALEPDPGKIVVYAQGHKIYRALYPALKVIQ